MKRRFLLGLLAVVLLGAPGARALPGPDPADAPETFEIVFEETGPRPTLFYDRLPFARADGWDFGDREAYRCAFVEYLFDEAGSPLFKVEVELNVNYPVGVRINDRGGIETGDGDNPPTEGDICGSIPGVNNNRWLHDPVTEDHFPHFTIEHTGAPPMELYVEEEIDTVIDLRRGECDRGYWTSGNEAGEAILWWDVDGPSFDGHHELDCGGGPTEPLAVARMLVIPVGEGTGVCTQDDLDGIRCTGAVTPPAGPVCFSGDLVAEDGSGRTLHARVCE